MKRIAFAKAIVLSCFMAAAMALPMTSYAQRNDDFFRAEEFNNRLDNVIWGVIVTQDPMEPAPLGSGLLILTAAGAGYVAVKRRKTFKKGVAIMLAFSMLLGLTQCKKHLDVIETVDKGIPMTLDAYNGAKTVFNMSGDQLQIAWGTNEVIYVVCNGKCIGSVTNGAGGGGTFTGSVTDLTAGNTYTLHYYYVGTEQTIADNATSFTMTFSGQDGTLDNLGKYHIGYGTQTITYDGNPISAVAGLQSLVAIGYFDIAGMAEVGESVYMYGANLNNKIVIDFSTNTVTNTKVANDKLIGLGVVTSGATCGKYVMLVPNHTDGTELLATDITFISKRTTGTCNNTFRYGVVADRFYCKDGNSNTPIDVDETAYVLGTLRGEFSRNISGGKVIFAPGNLQATTSDLGTNWTWSFAEHQYDYIGNSSSNNKMTTTPGVVTANGTVDLFYRSLSNNAYGIVATGESSSPYYGADFVDWTGLQIGTHNSGYWRTLAESEWKYILGEDSPIRQPDATVNGVKNARCTKAIVNSVKGMIIFPDHYDGPTGNVGDDIVWGTGINSMGTKGWNTTVTEAGWATLEAAGCVFLPAAGRRSGTNLWNIGTGGYYKHSTYWRRLRFDNDGYDTNESDGSAASVRLVHNVE